MRVIIVTLSTYKEQLEALKGKCIVFIFDECHRSLFGQKA